MSIPPLTIHEADALALRYGCVRRTIYRMKSRGIEVSNPLAVAAHLASLRTPSPLMVESILKHIPTQQ